MAQFQFGARSGRKDAGDRHASQASGDTIPADTSTTADIDPSSTTSSTELGFINHAGDADWYRMPVTAGVQYTIILNGYSSSASPVAALPNALVRVYDAGGQLVGTGSPGSGGSSSYTYTATASGHVFVSAEGLNGATGRYATMVVTGSAPPADSVPDHPGTTASVAVGGSVAGAIETTGDVDWFKVTLQAGVLYEFNLVADAGTEGLDDPYLEIRGPGGGAVLEYNDDWLGEGTHVLNSRLTFMPAESGTYHLAAQDFEKGAGRYTLSAKVGSYPPLLSTIDWGTSLGTTQIDVYFVPGGQTVAGDVQTLSWSAYERQRAMAALATFEAITPLRFTLTETPETAEFRLALTSTLPELEAFFTPPGEPTDAGLGVFARDGDGWDEDGAGGLEAGGRGFALLIHEFGHGLGLDHPQDAGRGRGTVMPGVNADFDSLGVYGLNQGVNTIMSYNNGWRGAVDFAGQTVTAGTSRNASGNQQTPMALDIAVLQQKYGANSGWRTGDDTYVMPGAGGAAGGYLAIWDAGGVDTIRFDGAEHAVIDLRAATLDYGATGGGFMSYLTDYGFRGGFTIAAGTVIENAVGGLSGDRITGNAAVNVLRGGQGFDKLFGLGGDDLLLGDEHMDSLDGGDGADRLLGGADGDYLLGGAGDDLLDGEDDADTLDGGGGNDRLFGGGQRDVLQGGDGDDLLEGAGDRDDLDGGAGRDRLLGGLGIDVLKGGADDDTLDGGEEGDSLDGGPGADLILGGAGNDSLTGGAGLDELRGGEGRDSLNVDSDGQADRLYGEGGDDTTYVGNGADPDRVWLGDGADLVLVYVHRGVPQAAGSARIEDFSAAQGDRLDLTRLVAEFGQPDYDAWGSAASFPPAPVAPTTDPFGARYLRLTDSVDGVVLEVDRQGGGDRFLPMLVLTGLDTAALGKAEIGYDPNRYTLGGAAADAYFGDAGRDVLAGFDGADLLASNGAADTLYGGLGDDRLYGGPGADLLLGEQDRDELWGGGDADRLYGGSGRDLLVGEGGADELWAGEDDDRLYGSDGRDLLVGEGGADELWGGGDDDQLYGSGGSDVLVGEAGNDAAFGGEGADLLSGFGGADALFGEAGDDRSYGDQDDDLQVGHGGADELWGGDGEDRLYGSEDADLLVGESGRDELWGGSGADRLYGAGDADVLVGEDGQDELWGGGGDDAAYGSGDADLLVGEDGNDGLFGGDGADTLFGSAGVDLLVGEAGADVLFGGGGDDRLAGGAGGDRFVFEALNGVDTVVDFRRAEGDRLTVTSGRFTTLAVADVDGDGRLDSRLDHAGGTVVVLGVSDLTLDGWNGLLI